MNRREMKDDHGKPFWVVLDFEDEERPVFRIRRDRFPIGHVMIHAYYSTWHVNDLVIESETREQILLGRLPVLPARKYLNRDRGIGMRVMQLVIEEARTRQVSQITGDVVPEHPEDAERLKHFYARLGFRIEPALKGAMEGAVARFVMDIEEDAG